jgi:predicted phosphodiesterase
LRVFIISDIHSNLQGMEACLKDAPSHDAVINLGDIVGYGGSPNDVTDASRKLGGQFVRGNHDKACTGITGIETFNPIAGLAALWTKQTLTPENLTFLKDMPQGPISMNGLAKASTASQGLRGVQIVHGSPRDEDEYIIVMRDAVEPLSTMEVQLTFFGHTHIQGGFCLDNEQWGTLRPVYHSKTGAEKVVLELKQDVKYLINPGSAGQPRDGDPRAAYVIFDTETLSIAFHRVPYDVKAAQKIILDNKLPERLATRLSEGR